MKQEWLDFALELSATPGDQYAGGKKYFRRRSKVFTNLAPDIRVQDVGYTATKLSLLKGLYIHEPSLELATRLWKARCLKKKPGSVSFHCYNHLLKSHNQDIEKTTNKIGSVMGPCVQSVVLSLVEGRYCDVDVYYRTTELFKKFPADLVMLNELMLSRFDFSTIPVNSINMTFSNITISQIFFPVILPLIKDPFEAFEKVKRGDPHFHRYIVRDTLKYLVPDKVDRDSFAFNQIRRSARGLRNMIDESLRKELILFLSKE